MSKEWEMLYNAAMNVIKPYEVSKNIYVGSVMPPCGAYRQFMMQLGDSAKEIDVLINNQGKTVKLSELMPEYPY